MPQPPPESGIAMAMRCQCSKPKSPMRRQKPSATTVSMNVAFSCPSRWEEAGEVVCLLKAAVAEHEVGTLDREAARPALRGNVRDGLDKVGNFATVLG